MTDGAALDRAIEIFRELGWDRARLSQTPDLPLGTTEQQHEALEGLRSGDWREFGRVGANRYGWISHVPVDHRALGVFAARVGVDARRTVAVLPVHSVDLSDEDLARMLIPRGAAFASQFVKAACVSSRRGWEHASSTHGEVAVRLAHAHDLAVPESVEYLKDWVVCAALALDRPEVIQPAPHGAPPDVEGIRRRYAEHVRVAVGAGLPVTGPFGSVFGAAVEAGWLARSEALDLAFVGLDAAQRPGDRKIWTTIVTDDLAVTDVEVAARVDALVPVLASGEGAVIEAFAPRLIATVGEGQLHDVLSVALLARSKKARRAVLAAVAARPRPGDAVVGGLVPLLAPVAADGDRQLSGAAHAVLRGWGAEHEPPPSTDATPAVRSLWQPMPPLWQVPRFELGEVSPAALTDAAARLVGRPEGAADVESERFLALANEVARRDQSAARLALRGVRGTGDAQLGWIANWVEGVEPRWGHDDGEPASVGGASGLARLLQGSRTSSGGTVRAREPLTARDWVVTRHLGETPLLLSQPTWVDLRIDPADLARRLRIYADTSTDALEADLQLALLRTDVTLADAATVRDLARMKVSVRLQSGRETRTSAGRIAADYLTDPVVEPSLAVDSRWQHWAAPAPPAPRSLRDLPDRVSQTSYLGTNLFAVFPTWGETGLLPAHHSEDARLGLALRQVARRAAPLPPGAVANMIGAQRSFHPHAAADGSLAILEAWQRGLLRDADIRYLDALDVPSSLAALARAGLEVAEEGLAAIVWQVLDQVVTASAAQPKLLTGTAEAIDAIQTLLPEVRAAVEQGLVEPSVLELPGVRTIAVRSGSSRPVELARSVVASLPDGDRPPAPAPAPSVAVLSAPLAEIWPEGAGRATAVVDGARLSVGDARRATSATILYVDLELDHLPGWRYRVVKGWMYDLETEGQCAAYGYPAAGQPPVSAQANCYLRWGGRQIVVSPHRDWTTGKDQPLSDRSRVPPLTTSMVAVVLVALCHDGDWSAGPRGALRELATRGLIGSAAVSQVMPALLTQPAVSPARMVGALKKEPTALPVAWPILVESIRFAAAQESLPRWLNQVLDVAIWFSPQLREAARLGWIPPEHAAWPGLAVISEMPGKSTAITKARTLLAQLALS